LFFKYLMKFLALVVAHIFGNRLISVPVGMALFGKWYIAVILLVFMDIIQVPFFYYFYESPHKMEFIRKILGTIRSIFIGLTRHIRIKQERNIHAGLLKRARSFGQPGVVLITAMPFLGGGMWSGVLLSHLLKIEKRTSYFLLACGSLLGCTFLALGFGGIKFLFLALVHSMRHLMF
jgi:uncharacterized membrane protein